MDATENVTTQDALPCEHYKTCRECPSAALADGLRVEEERQRARAEKAEARVATLEAAIRTCARLSSAAMQQHAHPSADAKLEEAWQALERLVEGEGGEEVEEMIEASSLGTSEAKAARESVPKEVVDRVLARADELGRAGEVLPLLCPTCKYRWGTSPGAFCSQCALLQQCACTRVDEQGGLDPSTCPIHRSKEAKPDLADKVEQRPPEATTPCAECGRADAPYVENRCMLHYGGQTISRDLGEAREEIDRLRIALGVIQTFSTDEWSRVAAQLGLDGKVMIA